MLPMIASGGDAGQSAWRPQGGWWEFFCSYHVGCVGDPGYVPLCHPYAIYIYISYDVVKGTIFRDRLL